MKEPAFAAAFDRAMEEVERALRAGMRTLTGQSAQRQLHDLRGALITERDAALRRGTVDPEWVRTTVRWVADWTPSDEIKLIAALGSIARAAGRPTPS